MFFYVQVRDMDRALMFYVNAFSARVEHISPTWCSLVIAGVRVNLVMRHTDTLTSALHFVVDDIVQACAAVALAGGEIEPAVEDAHAVVVEALDTEGNLFTFRQVYSLATFTGTTRVLSSAVS